MTNSPLSKPLWKGSLEVAADLKESQTNPQFQPEEKYTYQRIITKKREIIIRERERERERENNNNNLKKRRKKNPEKYKIK